MNLGQCPYISPLFITAFFSGLAHLFFFMFLLWDHNYSELMEWNFGGEFLLA